MAKRQPAWDKYEAAILMDGLIDTLENGVSRIDVIARVSRDLRQMAVSRGIEIDDTYRNEAGIRMQLQSMESAYYKQTKSLPSTKLFTETADMYKNDYNGYKKLLEEAKAMAAENISVEADFMRYLATKVSPAQLSELYLCYPEIEAFCLKMRILRKPLFETTDFDVIKRVQRVIEANKAFRYQHKRQINKIIAAGRHYYNYIKEGLYKDALLKPAPVTKPETAATETPPTVSEPIFTPEEPTLKTTGVMAVESVPKAAENAAAAIENTAVNISIPVLPAENELDNEFSQKYPVIYKRLLKVLSESDKADGISTEELCDDISRIAVMPVIKEILDNVSWAAASGGNYIYSANNTASDDSRMESDREQASVLTPDTDDIATESGIENLENADDSASKPSTENHENTNSDAAMENDKNTNEPVENAGVVNGIYTVDFEKNTDLAFTKPVSFKYFGENIDGIVKSWKDLYVSVVSTLMDDYPHQFHVGMSFSPSGRRAELLPSSEARNMLAPTKIPGKLLIIETNYNAGDIVSKIKYMLDLCNVDYENIEIKYQRKHVATRRISFKTPPAQITMPETEESVNEETFKGYMINERHMMPGSCKGYASAIKTCETFAREHKFLHYQLYTNDRAEAMETANLLLNSEAFNTYNEKQYGYYRSALKRFIDFIDNGSSKRDIPTRNPNAPKAAPQKQEMGKPTNAVPPQISLLVNSENDFKANTEPYHTDINDEIHMEHSTRESRNEERVAAEIEKCVMNADVDGISYNDLCLKLSFRPTMTAVKAVVAKNKHIAEIKGRLYHENALVDWDEGARRLHAIIEKLMRKNNGYISAAQLYDYAHSEMNMFLNDNDMDDERSVFDIAQHLFEKNSFAGKSYSFTGKMHISQKENAIGNIFDIICKFADEQGGIFDEKELEEYLKGIGIKTVNLRNQMHIHSQPEFFFYDTGTIIYAKSMGIDDSWKECVGHALNNLFGGSEDHIILRNIHPVWFEQLPALPGNRPWTALLLQSVLRFFGKQFGVKTIAAMSSQSIDTLHAMLIKEGSPIQSFADAVVSYLIENDIDERNFEAEELRHLLISSNMIHGNELIWNMPKALANDERFAWDIQGKNVTIRI